MLALLSAALFAWGFLLVRRTSPHTAPCLAGEDALSDPPLARAVIVVLDGLRFADAPSALSSLAAAAPPGAAWGPARLLAHPPTATLPSVRSILTGGLPAFVDVGRGVLLGSQTVAEDTWVGRVRACSATATPTRVAAFGDASWHALLGGTVGEGGALDGGWAVPALDVGSLDDSRLWAALAGEVDPAAWAGAARSHVTIAHANALDHAQHASGAGSPPVKAALTDIDANLTALARALTSPSACAAAQGAPGDTLLLVLGDHGATGDGNHGGASRDETGTAVLAVSVRAWCAGGGVLQSPPPPPPPAPLHTTDLAPALALLLGAPPPHSSLGRLPRGLWELVHGAKASTYAAALRINTRQVGAYLSSAPWAGRSAGARAAAAALEAGHAAWDQNNTAAATAAWERGLDAALAAAHLDHATFGWGRMGLGLAGLVGVAASRVWVAGRSSSGGRILKPPHPPRRLPVALLLPILHAACLFSVGALQAEVWVVAGLSVGLLLLAQGHHSPRAAAAALAAAAATAAFLPRSPRTAAEAMHLVAGAQAGQRQHTALPWALAAAQAWLSTDAAASPATTGVAFTLAARSAFHASGHFCEVAGLRMGLTGGLPYGAAVSIVILDALAPFFAAGAAARLEGPRVAAAARAAGSVLLAGAAAAAAAHARHILAPSVFAPRFLFELAFYVATWVGGAAVGERGQR